MKKSWRMILVLAVLGLTLGISQKGFAQEIPGGVPIVGGYGDTSKDDPEVKAAAQFAIKEQARKQRARIKLVAIERAEVQVVAGLNYKMHLKVEVNGRRQEVTAVVYRNLRQKYSLSSWVRSDRTARICSDPSQPCVTSAGFEPYDLPFELPASGAIFETQDFYAIILKSMTVRNGDCERFVPEPEREQSQALFPRAKVFASRPCNPGGLFYVNTGWNQQFMAVYAGETRAQAGQMLAAVKATGKFPDARIRRMRVGFNGT